MPTHEENILRMLGEAEEPLFASEIAGHLNSELRPDSAYSTVEVAKCMKKYERASCALARWAVDAQAIDALITSGRLAVAGIPYPIQDA